MRAAVYRGADQVRVEELPVPEIGPGELLVQVHTCGVCGTDLKKIHYGLVEAPRVFGHEIAGTVAAVSSGEREWEPGQRVIVQHHVPCGDCFYCRRRLYASCPVYKQTGVTAGFEPAGGGFAEFVRVLRFARRGVVSIPDEVSFEEASFLEPLNTVLKGVRTAHAEAGETALVIGQGPIGLLFTQALRAREVEVIATDLHPARRAVSERFGALAVDPAATDVAEICRARTGGRGADLAVVAVASTAVIPEALAAVRPAGRVLLFAQTRLGEPMTVDAGQVCMQEKALLGSYSADIDLQPLAAELLFSRQVQVAPLISHRFPLEQIGDALRVASNPGPDSLKVVVQP
ncbi:MAG: Sorbitol dehydrogenase [Armatimonadetes bacterium]|nr:Sorbitol dehydrogenase [Armatimonadota bacterium]